MGVERTGMADPRDDIERGRACHARRSWGEAYRSLALADEAGPLAGADLELLAMSAYLSGRGDLFLKTIERAHHAHGESGEAARAVRCAFWLGLFLVLRGEIGRATGWLARARRLLEREPACAEQGYLLLPVCEQHLGDGELDAAYQIAGRAAEIGDRFAEPDLTACARHIQGRALVLQGKVEDGLALLDEAMVAVIAGEVSPLMTGLVYCSVIETCQLVCALGRAREWTAALAQWCEGQPDLIAFSGTCLVHRAEILQLQGDWQAAIDEATRAGDRYAQGGGQQAAAAALYQKAEVYRLRGEMAAAEEAYRSASQWGCDPQPGLALLRVAQGKPRAAAAAIRRVVGATADRLGRIKLLPACVEILIAAGDLRGAREASRDLDEIARSFASGGVLGALAAHARGAIELAEGDARAALGSSRLAWQVWQQVGAPHAAARARILVGLACRALGDGDGAALELDAARVALERLGAATDLARLERLAQRAPSGKRHGLTARELQVLRLVATGRTNRAIAAELSLSEKTVDRHVSNILGKLDVSSRAAATAYGYEHALI